MMFKRILLIGIVLIFMTGTLSTEAATQSSAALEPWTTGVIDQATDVYLGQHVSIDHYKYNGSAYVSYYDQTNGNLKLAYEVSPGTGNCPGNANWKCETVDETNDVGKYSSIDVFESSFVRSSGIVFHYAKIGISYYDDTANSLKYAQKSCRELINGLINCLWSITTVDDDVSVLSADNIGQYTSFQFNSTGNPVIHFHGESTGIINYIGYVKRAILTGLVTGSCGAGWQCEVIAQHLTNRAYGTHISADGINVAFYDGAGDQLVLARPTSIMSNTCGLVNYWDCYVVDTTGDVGRFVSLVADPLQMVYYDATNGNIKHAIATSGSGNCGGGSFSCKAVDTIGVAVVETGIGLSMILDAEGAPIIAYQDFSSQQSPAVLKIARPSSVYGNMIGNCGEPPEGYLFMYWQCKYLDGGAERNMANYAAVSVSPAGLATVAYYESDEYYNLGRLKVTQQHFNVFLPLIIK